MTAELSNAIDQGPPQAVDKVYAHALFELAEAEGGRQLLEELASEMNELSNEDRDPQRREFFRSRLIPVAAKERVMKAAFEGRCHPLLFRFMMLLVRKERLDRIWRIFAAFDAMIQERFGRVEVDLFTRYPLPEDQLHRIRARLQEALGREPVLHPYIDDKMIGGIRVQYADVLIDASIDAQLRKMQERLVQRGSGTIRDRFDRAVEGT